MAEKTQPLHLKLTQWTETLEASHKLIIVSIPLVTALITMGVASWQVISPASPAALAAQSEAKIFLDEQLHLLRGPLPNALALWEYPPNLRTRSLKSVASPSIQRAVFEKIDNVDLTIYGWEKQLKSHIDGHLHVINKTDYEPGHAIRRAMNLGGVDQLVSAPVLKIVQGQPILVGYISIGFSEPIDAEELELIKVQMAELAILARRFY